MSQTVHGDTSGKVKIFPVLDIVDVRTLALNEDGRRSSVGRDHVWGMFGDEGSAGGIRRGIGVRKRSFPLHIIRIDPRSYQFYFITHVDSLLHTLRQIRSGRGGEPSAHNPGTSHRAGSGQRPQLMSHRKSKSHCECESYGRPKELNLRGVYTRCLG